MNSVRLKLSHKREERLRYEIMILAWIIKFDIIRYSVPTMLILIFIGLVI